MAAVFDQGFVDVDVVFSQRFLITFQPLRGDVQTGGGAQKSYPAVAVLQEVVRPFVTSEAIVHDHLVSGQAFDYPVEEYNGESPLLQVGEVREIGCFGRDRDKAAVNASGG